MNSIFQLLIRFVLQLSLLLIGLLIVVVVFFTALILFICWLAKAFWCRLTNRPIKPWRFNLNNGWQTMYRYRNHWQKNSQAKTAGNKATKLNEAWQQDNDITDVEFKP